MLENFEKRVSKFLRAAAFGALQRENIVKKNNINCIEFKVSVIQACVNFVINCTKFKYTVSQFIKKSRNIDLLGKMKLPCETACHH